jgi:hypothetical protein
MIFFLSIVHQLLSCILVRIATHGQLSRIPVVGLEFDWSTNHNACFVQRCNLNLRGREEKSFKKSLWQGEATENGGGGGGREGRRERGKEGEREGGREGRRERGKEGEREGGREGRRERGEERGGGGMIPYL